MRSLAMEREPLMEGGGRELSQRPIYKGWLLIISMKLCRSLGNEVVQEDPPY